MCGIPVGLLLLCFFFSSINLWILVIMPRKMNINRLSQDELAYELVKRGLDSGETVEEMRKILSQARKMEKVGNRFSYPDYPFTFEEDTRAVEAKLNDLSKEIDSCERPITSNNMARYEGTLEHLAGRVERMCADSEDRRKTRSALMVRMLGVMAKLEGVLRMTMIRLTICQLPFRSLRSQKLRNPWLILGHQEFPGTRV